MRHTRRALATHINTWAVEVTCCLLALCLLVALALFLNTYDGEALARWRYGFTINTVVALLATLMRSIISVPIAEGSLS